MITQDFNASAVGILLCFVGWWQCADGATREEDLHLPVTNLYLKAGRVSKLMLF